MNAAGSWLFETHQYAQQGGLADAVWADDGDPSALRYTKRNGGENIVRSEGFCQI